LFAHTMMFWTGLSRDAGSVLTEQQSSTKQKMRELIRIRGNAHACQLLLRDGFHAEALGGLLHDSWQLKRQLATKISNSRIDQWYQNAMDAGALGGKLCGAGGGGFLLFIVPVERQKRVRQALGELSEISIGYEPLGSRVLMPNIE
jgi:D-glycero-alpha-D-manno-heptose-7-phosphate kinase